jgi:hypothetical protein
VARLKPLSKPALALLLLGLAQMAGDLLRIAPLKAIGAATAASPAPRVFSAVRGYETYSTRFYIEWTDWEGAVHSLLITPQVYAHLAGPYNRRNVYGAALSYGPVLASDPRTRPMLDSVMQYALCGNAPLLREIGIDPATIDGNIRIRFQQAASASIDTLPACLEAPCR